MAAEFVDYGIRANAVVPGWIVAEMHFGNHPNPAKRKQELEQSPIKSCIMSRLGGPEEVASVIAFLMSEMPPTLPVRLPMSMAAVGACRSAKRFCGS